MLGAPQRAWSQNRPGGFAINGSYTTMAIANDNAMHGIDWLCAQLTDLVYEQVNRYLGSWQAKKASDLDKISNKIIKTLKSNIAKNIA